MSIIWTVLIVLAAIAAVKIGVYFALKYALDEEPQADEIHTLTTGDGWRIKLLRRRHSGEPGEPVFICHGMSANYRNLATPPGASLTDFLVEQGYDCWLIDLRGNKLSEPPPGTKRHEATFDGYVMQDVPAALDFIRDATGYAQVHWVGHSLGGMIVYAYEVAHGRDRLASATTLGSPTGFDHAYAESQSALFTLMTWFPALAERYEQALMPIIGWFKPRLRLMPINWKNVHPDVGPKDFYNLSELPPLPVARTMMDCALHRYWAVNNDTINVLAGLKTLRTPLFVIVAARDPLAMPSQVREFFDALPSEDKRYLELSEANGYSADYDHIDLAFARNSREEVFQPISEWIAAHPAKRSTGPATKKEALEEAGASVPSEKRARVAATPEPVGAEATAPAELAPTPAARGEVKSWPGQEEKVAEPDDTLWGKALKDAADILSGLDESADNKGAGESGQARRPGTKRPARKAARGAKPAKKAARKKPAAKKTTGKSSAKARSATKGATSKNKKKKKKPATKRKAKSASKPATKKKSPSKKKALAKKTAKKRGTTKKSAVKKKRTQGTKKKAAIKKKPAAKKKKTSKKKTTRKSASKKKKSGG